MWAKSYIYLLKCTNECVMYSISGITRLQRRHIGIKRETWYARAGRAPEDPFGGFHRSPEKWQANSSSTASWSQGRQPSWPPLPHSRVSLLHWAARTQPLAEETPMNSFFPSQALMECNVENWEAWRLWNQPYLGLNPVLPFTAIP